MSTPSATASRRAAYSTSSITSMACCSSTASSRLLRTSSSGRSTSNEEVARWRGLRGDDFEAQPLEALAQQRVRRVVRRRRAERAGDQNLPARRDDAGELAEVDRHIQLHDEVEGAIVERQRACVRDLEA